MNPGPSLRVVNCREPSLNPPLYVQASEWTPDWKAIGNPQCWGRPRPSTCGATLSSRGCCECPRKPAQHSDMRLRFHNHLLSSEEQWTSWDQDQHRNATKAVLNWKPQTLLAAALTLGLASKMKSLWDWALASMIAWRYFSSSLLRFPFTPTMGWLQRVTVAWLSGWIHDSTCSIKCNTTSAQALHRRKRQDLCCRLTGILPFARKAATLFSSSSGMLTGTTKVDG